MITIVSLINLASVCIFGVVLSASFCDIVWTQQKCRILAGGTAFILLLQGIVYYLWGGNEAVVKTFYPIITHLPLVLLLGALTKQYLWSVISILTAYLFCQIRRWLALFIVAISTSSRWIFSSNVDLYKYNQRFPRYLTIFSGDSLMQNIAEFLITLPLLFIMLKFVASAIRSISHYSTSEKCQFGLIPAVYYAFDYATRVYTHLYAANSLLVIEFMQFVCGGIYIMFVLYSSKGDGIRRQLQQTQEILNLQVSQAAQQIESLRESQQAATVYRHDLRHHMQYLSSCIENERFKQAQDYIQAVCSEIETKKIVVFCENETVNLILSAFAGRAEHYGIPMQIKAVIPHTIPVSESDLCVLLSNGLENALNACRKLKEEGLSGTIEVSAYTKNEKIFLQIINSCLEKDILFINDIPVTNKAGHGIGVRSICSIVERYHGIYTFSVKDGMFILRVSL